MSTSEKLNQLGVVIICIITHCGNGFQKLLLSEECSEITGKQPRAFSMLSLNLHEVGHEGGPSSWSI